MHLCCFFLRKIVANYALLVCTIFGPKIRLCDFFLTNLRSDIGGCLQVWIRPLPIWVDTQLWIADLTGFDSHNLGKVSHTRMPSFEWEGLTICFFIANLDFPLIFWTKCNIYPTHFIMCCLDAIFIEWARICK